MTTLQQREMAVEDVTTTLMEWFHGLTQEECRRIALLAVAAYDRAAQECDQFDGGDDA